MVHTSRCHLRIAFYFLKTPMNPPPKNRHVHTTCINYADVARRHIVNGVIFQVLKAMQFFYASGVIAQTSETPQQVKTKHVDNFNETAFEFYVYRHPPTGQITIPTSPACTLTFPWQQANSLNSEWPTTANSAMHMYFTVASICWPTCYVHGCSLHALNNLKYFDVYKISSSRSLFNQ